MIRMMNPTMYRPKDIIPSRVSGAIAIPPFDTLKIAQPPAFQGVHGAGSRLRLLGHHVPGYPNGPRNLPAHDAGVRALPDFRFDYGGGGARRRRASPARTRTGAHRFSGPAYAWYRKRNPRVCGSADTERRGRADSDDLAFLDGRRGGRAAGRRAPARSEYRGNAGRSRRRRATVPAGA